jgi:hypothetical protein
MKEYCNDNYNNNDDDDNDGYKCADSATVDVC